MWNHSFSFAQISASASAGSMLVEEVVPRVATTQNGCQPSRRSSAMALSSASGRMRNSWSTGMWRTPARPMPVTIAAFSTEEWVSVET